MRIIHPLNRIIKNTIFFFVLIAFLFFQLDISCLKNEFAVVQKSQETLSKYSFGTCEQLIPRTQRHLYYSFYFYGKYPHAKFAFNNCFCGVANEDKMSVILYFILSFRSSCYLHGYFAERKNLSSFKHDYWS